MLRQKIKLAIDKWVKFDYSVKIKYCRNFVAKKNPGNFGHVIRTCTFHVSIYHSTPTFNGLKMICKALDVKIQKKKIKNV